MNNEQKHLTFLEQFISKHYLTQPLCVRTFTYVIFVMLLVFAIYRLTAGEFSIRGRILQKVDHGYKPAKNYEVRVRDKFFGTNSRGFYYLIFTPSQYYKLMLSGKLALEISTDETVFPPQTVDLQRFDQELKDITFPLSQEVRQLHERREFETPLLGRLITSTWALDAVELGDDRLFVTAVQLKSNLPRTKEGELNFRVGKESLNLLAVQARGMPAGPIPIVSGETIFLGTDYYFKLPQSLAPSLLGQIKLSTKSGIFLKIFFPYSETFRVSLSRKYGHIFTASGDKGSKVDLLLLSPYDVAIWQKQDLEDVKEELKSQFIQNGFRVLDKRSLLGYKAQTNALFGGKLVPFTILQKILNILTNQQVKIKTIQYQLNLKSGNPYEIQVAGSAAFNDKPQIPAEKLDQLKKASTEEEFKGILKEIQDLSKSDLEYWQKSIILFDFP